MKASGAVLALILGAVTAPAFAVTDPLATCGPQNFLVFGSPDLPPLPPGFFGPGSDPFIGSVCFEGVELDPVNLELASVQMQWPIDPVPPFAPPGTQGTVPIEIVALSLVSCNPITVTYNGGAFSQQWDMGVTLSNIHPPQGILHAVKTHSNGGTFDSQFLVQPKFTFVQVEAPNQVIVLDTGEFGIPPVNLHVLQGTFVHNLNPILQVIPPGPFSQFVPGVQQFVPGNLNSQVLVPFTAATFTGGVTHTVCADTPKVGRCEVVSKTIPNGHVVCQVVVNGDGTKNITDPFTMDAEFRSNCACCEYRQKVKGEFTLNGMKVNHVLEAGVNLDKNLYKEDGFGAPPPAGINQHYGHRGEPNNPAGDRYSNPAVRGAGCTYHGYDAPGWNNLDPGDVYSTDLHFVGVIEDVCNQVSLLPVHMWDVNCAGVALDALDPLIEVLFQTTINGRDAVLGIYRYPGNIITIVASISNGMGDVPIDASEVTITVLGLPLLSAPGPGPLPDTILLGASAQAMYNFGYPPGSPNPIHIHFGYGPGSLDVDVNVALPCPADLNGDGSVGVVDFLALLGAWGPCNGCPPVVCPADLNGDCQIGVVDFLTLLGVWGPCP